jgi:hypothetical protein
MREIDGLVTVHCGANKAKRAAATRRRHRYGDYSAPEKHRSTASLKSLRVNDWHYLCIDL